MNRRPKRAWLALAAAASSVLALAPPVSAEADDAPPPAASDKGRYVVVMEDAPLVTEFGTDNVDSAAAQRRAAEMTDAQEDAAAVAGIGPDAIATRYTIALNGFAVEMTEDQAARIKTADGVLMVLEDFLRQPQTDSSGEFLGLTGPGNAWASGLTGEGVIVGVIDSGIWPESASFADTGYPDPGIELDESQFPACDFGNTAHNPEDVPFTCNNKLLGARQILPTYRSVVGADPAEFDSARDDDGHGTHTASTAAGNANVQATIAGRRLGKISGVAPRAHIIAYKALGVLGGFTSDLALAIDQAVADGVDVINYSIGGGAGGVGADEIAFLFAADAGVHVATSAGNSGPGAATLGDPATKPWLTSVGASTQRRSFEGKVIFSARQQFSGVSLTPSLPNRPVVDAEFAGGDLCVPGTLDASVVRDKIVLCRRGLVGRADKSLAVALAGGAGMILYNNTDNDNLFSDPHSVPSVHVNFTDGSAIKALLGSRRSPQARIVTGTKASVATAPSMTFFSSRGPNPVAPDIIKPDITAPGLQILAAYSPYATPDGSGFASIAGTSMSSPHVAGLFALMKQAHPDWSAAAVKSALMTTAYQSVLKDDLKTAADPFDMGAGHANPGQPGRKGSMFQPGLVYEAGFLDYLGFLCDAFPEALANPAATCPNLERLGVPIKAVDLNYPSIGVANLAGSVTVTRTLTSVADQKTEVMYRPIIEAPAGFDVKVTPRTLKLKQGQSATFQVTITNVRAPIGEWRHGAITWTGGNYDVRSPISVRGTSLTAPDQVSGSGVDGSVVVPVRFGFAGPYTAAAHGLEPATVFSGTVDQDPDQTFDPADLGNGAELHEVTVSGAAALLIKMPPEVTEAEADLDLFVVGPTGDIIATSTAGGTDEAISLILPEDGTYQIYVHGWATVGPDSPYDLFVWTISATPGGNMTISNAPTSVSIGQTADLDVSWAGAADGQWHIGAVSHANASGLLGLTLVEVDNRPAAG